LLTGGGSGAEGDIVILNCAALLLTAGTARTLREGASLAREALRSGAAGRLLDAYVGASND
jgi:anthranilate phosphoribosyltransferase